MRRVLIRSVTALLVILSIVFAAIAVGVYSLVGFSNTIETQNLTTPPAALTNCTSMVIDVENAQVSKNQGDFILGNREVYVSFDLYPDQNVTGVVLDKGVIEDVLLGRQTCVIDVVDTSNLSLNEISSGDQSIDLANVQELGEVYAGNPMDIPLVSSVSRSIVIVPETAPTDKTTLSLSGTVTYVQAQKVLSIAGISSAFLAVAALLFGWTTRKRSS